MDEIPALNTIGLKHGTDKASSLHNYLEFYEIFFASLRKEPITILEIGVLKGASLKTWEEYFPRAKIIGADIVAATKRFEHGRVTIELLDQSNVEELVRIAVKHGPFDIIVEDGSHFWEHQITSLRTLFPFVKPSGLYIVEDLQTNYGSLGEKYKGIATRTCVDYLKDWLDLKVADDQLPLHVVEDAFLRTYGRAIQHMSFYRRACLIKKAFTPVVREISPGQPLARAVPPGPVVTLGMLAHVTGRGDVFGAAGFVNLESDKHGFQGFQIDSDEPILEYRVRRNDSAWSEWTVNNNFAGSRGQSKLLTGAAFRLRPHAKERYRLRTLCRFEGSDVPLEAADGQDCVAPSGAALCGLQVLVTKR